MSYGFGPSNTRSAYLPPEFQVPEDDVQARDEISQRERLTATILNVKTNGQFELSELITGEQWFSNQSDYRAQGSGSNRKERYGYRQVFDLVALNNGTPIPATGAYIPFAHNLPVSNITAILRIFGGAIASSGTLTNIPNFLPIPYPSAVAANTVEVYFDSQNIYINVGTAWGPLNPCLVCIEYLKQP